MISRYMGPHYGNNVTLPGAGTYQLSLLISPPVSARHIEYKNVWLKPHRVNFVFHWKPVDAERAGAESAGAEHAHPPALPASAAPRSPPAAPRARPRARPARRPRKPPRRGRARAPAGRPARAPVRLDGDARARHPRQPDLAALRPAALLRRPRAAPTPAHARLLEASLRTLERTLPLGPRRPPVHRRLGRRTTSSTCSASPRRSRGRRTSRTSSCRPSTTTTSASTSPATTSSASPTSSSRSSTARRSPARRPARLSGALRWRETRTGFVGAGPAGGPPARQRHPAGQPGAARPRRCSWASSRACAEPGDRGRRHDPRRPVRRRHDDAGQLHAPAARQLVRALNEHERVARMYAPEVTPAAGRALHDDAPATPTARRRRSPLRRRRPLPDLGPRPAQRQAADHPPRLRHRRRRPRRAPLRLDAALDRRLRHDPQRDERGIRASKTPRSPTRSTTASTSSSSCSSAPTTSSRRGRSARSRSCRAGARPQLKLRRARGSGRRRPPAAPCRAR